MADRHPRGWFSRDDVITAMADRYSAGEPVAAIARDLGCSIHTVYRSLEIADVELRPRGLSTDPVAVERILARRRAGEALPAIAADCAVTPQAICEICTRHGIRDPRPQSLTHRPDLAAQIRARLLMGHTKTAIARDLRTSRTHVDRLLRRHEVAA
jgi:transposase-like protein